MTTAHDAIQIIHYAYGLVTTARQRLEMATQSAPKIYQIKITLNDSKPPIWRRLLVPSSIRLSELHDVLQIAMGWTDSHLHQFIAAGRFYGQPMPECDVEVIDEQTIGLNRLLKHVKDAITYEYDFGDGWEHKIVLENILPFDPGTSLPTCITGKRACPPEDVGGLGGYAEFLQALSDPDHPEHEAYLEWIGGAFDPAYFNINEVNAALARAGG